jgi:hypothetical protein
MAFGCVAPWKTQISGIPSTHIRVGGVSVLAWRRSSLPQSYIFCGRPECRLVRVDCRRCRDGRSDDRSHAVLPLPPPAHEAQRCRKNIGVAKLAAAGNDAARRLFGTPAAPRPTRGKRDRYVFIGRRALVALLEQKPIPFGRDRRVFPLVLYYGTHCHATSSVSRTGDLPRCCPRSSMVFRE